MELIDWGAVTMGLVVVAFLIWERRVAARERRKVRIENVRLVLGLCPSCGNGDLRSKCEVCHMTGYVKGR
jgi:hypothetical protein